MRTQIAIIVNRNKLAGKVTNFFTGCYAYHTAIVIDDKWMYDITTKKKRLLVWDDYRRGKNIHLFDSPVEIRLTYLIRGVNGTATSPNYGYADYAFFLVRLMLNKMGIKKVRGFDFAGVICSEFVNQAIVDNGGETPFDTESAPPSPCDLWRWLGSR